MALNRRFAQLRLELGDFPGAGLALPWGGQSPRVLTRAFAAFSFRREGMGRLSRDASHVGEDKLRELQLELPFPFVGEVKRDG